MFLLFILERMKSKIFIFIQKDDVKKCATEGDHSVFRSPYFMQRTERDIQSCSQACMNKFRQLELNPGLGTTGTCSALLS